MMLYQLSFSSPDAEEYGWAVELIGGSGIEITSPTSLQCFFHAQPTREELSYLESFHLSYVDTKEVAPENWMLKARELFKELSIGNLTIRPVESLEEGRAIDPRNPNDLVIIPGMGFGTGHHPTTAMIIALLQECDMVTTVLQERDCFILDVGTGSGILAIAATKSAPHARIHGIDTDTVAIDNARENLSLNEPHHVTLEVGELRVGSYQQVPLIIANIYTPVLLALETTFAATIRSPGGLLMVSGIQASQADELRSYYVANSWRLVSERTERNWYAAVFERIGT